MDYYNSFEECTKAKQVPPYQKPQTNAKYTWFRQIYFTAGDEDQFMQAVELGKCYSQAKVKSTFMYLFNKFKKAIYIRIRNGELEKFLPFSKVDYVNDWGVNIRPPSNYKTLVDFLQHISKLEGREFDLRKIQTDRRYWYANNCLVRYDKLPPAKNPKYALPSFASREDDTSVPIIHDMFIELCKLYKDKLPNIEFFIHKRDFPLRRLDNTESYTALYGDGRKLDPPFDKYHYSHIFAFCTTAEHADLCIPTWDDWAQASQHTNPPKFFVDACKLYDASIGDRIEWETKKPVAVFRGSTTGCGVTPDTNPRLKLALMSANDQNGILDAGIHKWNLRPKCHYVGNNDIELRYIEIDKPPLNKLKLLKPLTAEEQASYKYIINIDGNVTAFRISYELSLGSVVLYTDDSPYYTWMTKSLVPWVHYVPIRTDLADLYDKIAWCKANDDKCRQISMNARDFYKKYVTKAYMLEYLQTLLYYLK